MRVRGGDLQSKIYKEFPWLLDEHSRHHSGRTDIHFVPVTDQDTKAAFDYSLDVIHYARSCQRVGRCLRLCVYDRDTWVGGIVLGSTFPNIDVRDQELGFKTLVTGVRRRGLKNPWVRENEPYWSALQYVVNHARTFIFPQFQGRGLGIAAHAELLNTGLLHWERRYRQPVLALDTLCTHSDSKLFSRNGWKLIGNTRGYTSDPSTVFSSRAFLGEWKAIRHNIALKRVSAREGRWWVWLTILDQNHLDAVLREKAVTTATSRPIRTALRLV